MFCRTPELLAARLLMGPSAPPPPAPAWRPTSIGSVDSQLVPVRCHWEYEESEAACADVLGWLEHSWAVQVDELGFAEPIPDDDGIVDFYLTDDQTGGVGGGYTDCDSYDDLDPTDGRSACAAYIAVDYRTPADELAAYTVHEFNHVLQYATDVAEPSINMWEATAQAAETWTYPGEIEPVLDYALDFQATPWVGILVDGYRLYDDFDLWSYYEYGAALWILHMDATYGDGSGLLGAELWWAGAQEGWTNEPDVLDAYDIVTGDWEGALLALTASRARMGTDLAPAWSSFMGQAGGVAVDATVDFADADDHLVLPHEMPFVTGAVYIELLGLQAGERVQLQIDGAVDVRWALFAVEDAEESWAEADSLTWTAGGGRVYVGAVNLGSATFDADDELVQSELVLNLSRQPAPSEAPEGCGCAAGGVGPRWLALVLALAGAVLRRRAG